MDSKLSTNRNKTYATSFLYRFVAYVLEQDHVNDERGLRSPKLMLLTLKNFALLSLGGNETI